MSDLNCPTEKLPQRSGKSYKGVENFLKRVAFNLGNTPSRTEVKIISCIPIDVSDLQQRIIYLEKQLEEARVCDATNHSSQQKRVVNTIIFDNKYPQVSHTGISCNALEMDRGTNPYDGSMSTKKKSNVSFLFHSDRGSHVNASSSHPYEEPYTANEAQYADIIGYENDMKPFTIGEVKPRQGRKNFFKKKKKAFRQKKIRNHYVYYAQTNSNPFNKYNVADEPSRDNRARKRSYIAKVIDKQYKPQVLGGNLSDISNFSSPICRDTFDCNMSGPYESDICSCCRGTYRNIDNHPIVYDSQQIYRTNNFATEGSFYDSTFYDVVPVKEKPVKIRKTTHVPKKREVKPSVDIMCWPEDVRTKLRIYPIYNPLYLDYTAVLPKPYNYLRKEPRMNHRKPMVNNTVRRRNNMDKQINMEMSKSSCIDFGDVYPKLVKKRIDRIDTCLHVDKCLTATQVPCRVDAECLTIVTNNSECQTLSSVLDTKDSMQSSDDKTEETLNQIKTILQSVLHEVKVSSISKCTSNEKSKKDATVQKGVSQGNMPGPIPINMTGSLLNNIGKPVQSNLSNLLYGNMPKSSNPLQTNVTNVQSNLPGNSQASTLLNSFTYSPYDIPPYLPSCSKQINPNQYYYSQSPLKCYQNFPLIVPNQGRPTCASCFRNNNHMKSYYGKQAVTIATNTDSVRAEHSKETEKLIKEIYRSMALTMGAVQKENSSEYEPLRDFSNHVEKSTRVVIEKPTPVKEFKKVTNVVQAVSELFRKRDMQVSSDSHNLIESKFGSQNDGHQSRYGGSHNTNTANTVTDSKRMSTDATTHSHSPTTNTTELDIKVRKERVEKFLDQTKRRLPDAAQQDKRKFYTATHNTMAAVDVTDTSSTESDTDETYVPTPIKQVIQKERKEKKGLLSKMFRSVKLFKPRDRKKQEKKEPKAETPTNEESSTDSDDYQTIYSQKVDAAPKHRPRVYNISKRRTHSKISYRHIYQRDKSPEKFIRRTPYMEQEYRRYWNEKLMFQDNRNQKHSSEHPHSHFYPGKVSRRVNPYYQTYEARAAIIEPKATARNEGMYGKKIVVPAQTKTPTNKVEPRITSKAMPWLKKHKIGNIRCGEHFKQLIKDN